MVLESVAIKKLSAGEPPAHDFGAIVPKKRADIVGAYYIDIYTYIALLQILGQLFPKNTQI